MNSRAVLILALVVLAVVAGAIIFLQSQSPVPAGAAAALATPASDYNPAPAPDAAPRLATSSSTPAAKNATKEPKVADAKEEVWEKPINDVLESNANETQMAQMLINLFPTLPPDGQEEAANHITNLVEDKDYNMILPMLRNAALPEDVQDVFVTDLMNRDDVVKLPALLEIAKMPNHPYHEEALTDLEVFLDGDYGNNWSKWDTAMKDYLKKQAEEDAAEAAAPVTNNPAPVNAPARAMRR